MDDIKLFAKNEKIIQAVRIYSENSGWNLAQKKVLCE